MNLWIESGATKTEFVVIDGTEVLYHGTCSGINPSYHDDLFMDSVIENIKNAFTVEKKIESVIYYGAGCLRGDNLIRVKRILAQHFSHCPSIQVHSDLLAACHALSSEKKSVVGILGTGAALCLYDKSRDTVEYVAPSLGYILGDEGSGSYLGKQFVIKYLRGEWPQEIVAAFEGTYAVNPSMTMNTIYKSEETRTFLASISPFIHEHLHNELVRAMVEQAFITFFENNISYFAKGLPWYFAGSVAFHYSDLLKKIANRFEVDILGIEKAPLLKLCFGK